MFVEKNSIKNISAKVRGCALCEASAGLVVKSFQNKKVPIKNYLNDFKSWLSEKNKNLKSSTPKELEIFIPIKTIKNRHTCILMPYEAAFKTLEKIIK